MEDRVSNAEEDDGSDRFRDQSPNDDQEAPQRTKIRHMTALLENRSEERLRQEGQSVIRQNQYRGQLSA